MNVSEMNTYFDSCDTEFPYKVVRLGKVFGINAERSEVEYLGEHKDWINAMGERLADQAFSDYLIWIEEGGDDLVRN